MKRNEIYLLISLIISVLALVFTHNKNSDLKINLNDRKLRMNELLLENDSLNLILDSLPLGNPLDSIEISERFGIRKHPITRKWKKHRGLDLAGTYKDTIYATGSGNIITAKRYKGYGRCVIIEHVGGYKSLYGHMNKVFVKAGDKVKDGDPVGTVGSTGFSTGTHLHYEICRFNKYADPVDYIND